MWFRGVFLFVAKGRNWVYATAGNQRGDCNERAIGDLASMVWCGSKGTQHSGLPDDFGRPSAGGKHVPYRRAQGATLRLRGTPEPAGTPLHH